MYPEKTERNSEMVRLKAAGFSYGEIGKKFGVTRQMVQKVLRPKVSNSGICVGCGMISSHLHRHHPDYNRIDIIVLLCGRCHLTNRSSQKRELTIRFWLSVDWKNSITLNALPRERGFLKIPPRTPEAVLKKVQENRKRWSLWDWSKTDRALAKEHGVTPTSVGKRRSAVGAAKSPCPTQFKKHQTTHLCQPKN